MLERSIGSLWTVTGIEGGVVVILVGPFAAARGVPEYVVAPVYTGNELGFTWTDEDVRLDSAETGLPDVRYAAIWNARPALDQDLSLQVGLLPESAIADVRDVYWASLNERTLTGPRLGKPISSPRSAVAKFQLAELARWEAVSGRVLACAESARVSTAPVSVMKYLMFTFQQLPQVQLDQDSIQRALLADPVTITDSILLASDAPAMANSMGTPSIAQGPAFCAGHTLRFEARLRDLNVTGGEADLGYAKCA